MEDHEMLKNYYSKMDPQEKASTIASYIGWWYFGNTEEANQLKYINDLLERKDILETVKDYWTEQGIKLEAQAFKRCHETIRELGITDLTYENGVVTITLNRPGIIIGAKGATIDALTQHLSKAIHEDLKIKLKETNRAVQNLYVYFPDY